MPDIKITVAEKIATNTTPGEVIVCGNSDYKITFAFDSEWSTATARTARFVYYKDGLSLYQDVAFTGATVAVPILYGVDHVLVGVYAGDLRTTTPAKVLCDRSILCGDPLEVLTPEEKAKLQAQIGDLSQLQTAAKANLVDAINEAAQSGGGAAAVDPEDIREAVNDYMEDNPPAGTADVTASAIESALGYTPAKASDIDGLSAQITDLSVFVTPQMFGAVGDGKTDDTEAFKKCFEHTNIHIPAGEYIVKETIEVLPRTNVTGDGQYPSKVVFASDVEGDVLFNVQEYASFSDINIGGSGTTAISTCTAIVFPFKILRLHNVRFRHLKEGVRSDAENVLYNTFVDCTFSDVKYPFIFPNATIFNTSIMQNLEFKNYNTVVTLPGTIYAISFDRCIFEGGEAGNYVLDAAEAASLSFDSCYYENHGELVTSNVKDGNITLRSTWVCVPDTVVLSGGPSCNLVIKFVDSTLENLNSDEAAFGVLMDGTNMAIDLVDCMTKSPTATALVPITTAETASQYGIANNCKINGGYLTLATLPVYGGEVE